MKKFLYRKSSSIILLIGFVLILIVFFIGGQSEWTILASLLSALISFVYFYQHQKKEELKIFIQLFEKFNQRYDQMNNELNKILKKSELNEDDRIKLYDYFNLCGEEYLYYSRGYIFDEVWEAWQNGMKNFLKNEQVYKLWEEDEKTKSYYGLKI